jgi:uncharacterized protein YbjT (DUF2867 family)
MTSPILLTGGTGTLGRLLVPLLHEADREVRVLSRQQHASAAGIQFVAGDLAAGEGIDAAVAGVQTIVHCAGSAKGDDDKTRTLVRAAARAGVRHLVYISVVGADRVPVVSGVDRAMFGYYAAKRAAERIVADSGLGWTILRATQFHSLMRTMAAAMAKMPIIPVPAGFRFQPIDAGEVATRLVELALGRPGRLVPEIGGPRVYEMAEILRSYLRTRHQHRLLLPVRVPGRAAGALRSGANLAPGRAVGRRPWEDFLSSQKGHVGGGVAEEESRL